MLVVRLMRWMGQLILAQLSYIWMHTGKCKSELVTYHTLTRFWYFVFIRVSDENPFSHRYVEAN